MDSREAAALAAAMVDENAAESDSLAREIWEHPEPAYSEDRASALHRAFLERRGFAIADFPEVPRSFAAERGTGAPVIAIMGEFDALPGMSQARSTRRESLVEGGPGHACGHNLLGAGSLAAAAALADAARRLGLPGRVRYYACPAEESLGRVPMVEAGRFSDVDAALTWHPADVNTVHRYSTSASLSLMFRFAGLASHAAMAPHAGRSALDAAQLMNLGIEFLREHAGPGVLLHYVIADGGAKANVVPASAAVSLYVRAPSAGELRAAVKRVVKIARGAAMMTETHVAWEAVQGKCDFIPNDALGDTIAAAMAEAPLPSPSAEELAFARALASTRSRSERASTLEMIGAPLSLLRGPIHREVGDFGRGFRIGGSLDTGDVSYVVPTAQMNAATWPLGIGAHTWQSCAASGSSFALKSTRWAASVLAAAGLALLSEPAILERASREHRSRRLAYRSTMRL